MTQNEEIPLKIDMARFRDLSDGDHGSLRELIELYVSKTTEQIQELDKRIKDRSSNDIARIAHSMIGANAMVGMDSLIPTLKKLETYGERQAIPEAHATFQEICKEFKLIHIALKKELENLVP